MHGALAFFIPAGEAGAVLAAVNEHLARTGLSITQEDALMLVAQRAQLLAANERMEFGAPAATDIAEVIASSPFLMQGNVVGVLADLQDIFYALRDEVLIDVPDAEIVEALRGCFDACEGDTAEIAALPKEEVMAFSEEYRLAQAAEDQGAYHIVDNEGRMYEFDPAECDYDEQAPGWDGEGWADGWDD